MTIIDRVTFERAYASRPMSRSWRLKTAHAPINLRPRHGFGAESSDGAVGIHLLFAAAHGAEEAMRFGEVALLVNSMCASGVDAADAAPNMRIFIDNGIQ